MPLTLMALCSENENPFRLTLRAGRNGVRNAVTWVYALEDDYIIPHFHGSELAVTTGIKAASDPAWLRAMARELAGRGAAGLVINTGKYVTQPPRELLAFCDEQDFPLLTMPWEIHVTEMIQDFCTRIIQERNDSAEMDRATLDAVYKRGSEADYRPILGRHYDLEGRFTVLLIRADQTDEEGGGEDALAYVFINRLRRFKTIHGMTASKFGLLDHDGYELLIANNVDRSMLPALLDIIREVHSSAASAGRLFTGVGVEVTGISDISRSFQRALAAVRMAAYQGVPCVRFEDMGFYKILFSVKDEEVLRDYADEILSPLEGSGGMDLLELLAAYIQNDRSLERTAAALYLHRNTVNYRLQKMKTLLGSPLKTVEDLFPYQAALAIRDMERHSQSGGEAAR